MSRDRVVVIGAGVNGLVAGALLAKRGYAVDIVERRDVPGGMAAGEEFAPGYRTAGLLHDTACFRPWIVRELQLEQHGLALTASPPDVVAPGSEGRGIRIAHDGQRAHADLAAVSAKDADAYVRFRAFLGTLSPVIAGFLDASLPDLKGSLWDVGRRGWAVRRLGRDRSLELLRLGPMCVADWLREWFETESVSCALAMPALLGGAHGPWSPATNALLVRREALAGPAAVRGGAAIVEALLGACGKHGAKVHLSSEVASIRFEGGRVVGVTFSSGDELPADVVLATCDPKTTVLRLIPRADCPPHLADLLRSYRCRGTTAKVHLALEGPFRFCGQDAEFARTGETLDGMERAFDPVKYGQSADEPLLDVFVPSVSDPSRAPEGGAVVSVLAHAVAPPARTVNGREAMASAERPDEDGLSQARASIGDRVVRTLSRFSPELPDAIVAREVLTPDDLQHRYGLWAGDLHHGDQGLDQLLARPTPECARYRTPWPGLFLGGGGSWPGGGLTGAPGALAAKAVASSGGRR